MTIILLGFLTGCFLAWLFEKRTWNNGVCRNNGLPWVRFDIDSQGGRGYKAGNNTCWISWPFIEKERP